MRVLFRTGGMLSFNLSAEGFNRLLIAISKGQDCLALAASHIVSLKHPDPIGHGNAQQEVTVANVINLRTSDCDLELHLSLK